MAEQLIAECPACRQQYTVQPDQVGITVQCTRCQTMFQAIPVQPAAPSFPPGPAPQSPSNPWGSNVPVSNVPPSNAPLEYRVPGFADGSFTPSYASPYLQKPGTSGMAIASLVCGCLFCVPLAALLAVIFGIIGIKQTRGNRVGGRGMAIAGLCLGGLQILVVPLVLASILFPAFSRGKAMAQRFVCAAQMGQIGRAIAVYESANGGAYPTDLPTLVSAGVVAPALFVCPSSHDTRANGAGDLMSGGHESYLYAGAGLTSSSSGRSVVLYEPLADHGDGINVLYADGSVRFVSRLSAGQLIAELESGMNPPTSPVNSAPVFPGGMNGFNGMGTGTGTSIGAGNGGNPPNGPEGQ